MSIEDRVRQLLTAEVQQRRQCCALALSLGHDFGQPLVESVDQFDAQRLAPRAPDGDVPLAPAAQLRFYLLVSPRPAGVTLA